MAPNESTNGSDYNDTEIWKTRSEIASSPYWFMSVSITGLLIIANGWIAFSLTHFVIVKKVFAKKRSRRDMNNGSVMALALVAVIMPFLRYAGTMFLLIVSLYPEYEVGCEAANDLSVVGFAFAVLPTHIYLWSRQRAFYGHPSLGSMFGTCVSVFSKISLILILLSAGISVGLGIHPKEYEPGPGGCFLIGSEEQNDYRNYIYALVTISSQISLLGLFLHPIIVHARHQREFQDNLDDKAEISKCLSSGDDITSCGEPEDSSNSDKQDDKNRNKIPNPTYNRSVSMPGTKSQVQTKSDRKRRISEPPLGDKKRDVTASFDYIAKAHKVVTNFRSQVRRSSKNRKLFRLIQRVLYLALISIFSDLLAMMLNQFAVPDDIPQTYSFVMFDINIFINILTVVLSFAKWREMITSPCSVRK